MFPENSNAFKMSKDYVKQGEKFKKNGEIEQAVEQFSMALQINPDLIIAHKYLAEIYESNKEYDVAVSHRQRLVQLKPNKSQAHVKLAKLMMLQGNTDEAIQTYYQAINLCKSSEKKAEIYWNLGKILNQNKQIDKATEAYEKAINLNPSIKSIYKDLASIKGLANSLIKKGDLSKTFEIYRTAIKGEPQLHSDSNSDFAKGFHRIFGDIILQLSTKRGQFDEASTVFQEAYEKYPYESWICCNLATALVRQSQIQPAQENLLEKAIEFYRKAISIRPDFWEAHFYLGDILLKQGNPNEAFQYYVNAVQANPVSKIASQAIFRWFKKYGNRVDNIQLEQAITAYQKVLNDVENKYNPNLVFLYHFHSLSLFNLGLNSEAIQYNQKACYLTLKSEKPQYVTEHWERGNLCDPSFLIIGVKKCATTALYDYMIEHPQILPAVIKECHFFDNILKQSKSTDRVLEESEKNFYRSHFPPLPEGENFVTGEATPSYLRVMGVENCVYQSFPKVKLILILRDPVKRAISEYNMGVRKKQGKVYLSFEETVKRELEEIADLSQCLKKPSGYLAPGLYVYFLERWMKLFPKEQFLILRTEDLSRDPATIMKQVFEFLDLPDYQQIQYPPRNKGTYSSKIDEGLRSELYDFYRPHNQRLEDFLGRKFNWEPS